MTDGRKHRPAHLAPRAPHSVGRPGRSRLVLPTIAALALGLTGSVVAAGPAGAADLDVRIDRAQAAVDRLDRVADARTAERDRAQERAGATRERLESLTKRIAQQERRADDLRALVAQRVLDEHATGDGDVTLVAQESDDDLSDTTAHLLSEVAMVTGDTGGASTDLMTAETARAELVERRAGVREVLADRRDATRRVETRLSRAGARLDAAQGRLSALEDRRAEQAAEQASSGAVAYAMAQVGKSYVWGAAGPSSFDCSGLTMAAWATEGVSLPHNSGAQYASGTPVSESELQPGDLVFYYSPISHVGIYVGNGQIVNALNPGTGVQISGLHDMPYSGAVRPG